MAGAVTCSPCGGQGQCFSFHGHFPVERTFFPFLQIAYHAEPCGVAGLLEIHCIVIGLDGFQTEYLYQRAGLFPEMQACLDHFRVVENHQFSLFQIIGKRSEFVLAHFSMPVHQQFRLVAYGQGEFGDAFIGQGIVEVVYLDMSGIFHYG